MMEGGVVRVCEEKRDGVRNTEGEQMHNATGRTTCSATPLCDSCSCDLTIVAAVLYDDIEPVLLNHYHCITALSSCDITLPC